MPVKVLDFFVVDRGVASHVWSIMVSKVGVNVPNVVRGIMDVSMQHRCKVIVSVVEAVSVAVVVVISMS
jgi:hypothetical protein